MCTVIYIPGENGDYLLASSRDEHKDRPAALPPVKKKFLNKELIFPKDPVGNGSWIFCYESLGLTLMNGAYYPHKRRLPYKFSRGLIPLKYILCRENGGNFIKDIRLEGVEPFTLISAESDSLKEYRWDGRAVHLHCLKQIPKIWASAPLYNNKMLQMRQKWFKNFLKSTPKPDHEDIFNFYLNGGNGDPYSGLIINRKNGVKTVSISCIEVRNGSSKMHYRSLQ